MRIRSSCSDRKKWDRPGSPWRPERPRNWLSMRRLSWRSVPIICSPPGADYQGPLGGDVGFDFAAAALVFSLVVDAGQFLGDAHIEIAAELDVGAAAGHVGGDGHRAGLARLGDDRGFLVVVAGVQDIVGNLFLFQQRGNLLGFVDRNGADQHRLPPLVTVGYELDDGVVFLAERPVDLVVFIRAHHWHVGRNIDDVEFVDFGELAGLGHCRAGHTGELGINAE